MIVVIRIFLIFSSCSKFSIKGKILIASPTLATWHHNKKPSPRGIFILDNYNIGDKITINFEFSSDEFDLYTEPITIIVSSDDLIYPEESVSPGCDYGYRAYDFYNPDCDDDDYICEDDDLYTDILVQIMTGKNNLIAQCEIYEAFPITLGAIEYSQQETDMTYAMCEVGFAYSWFDVKPISSTA